MSKFRDASSVKKYADIINMPHHVSKKHPHMSNYDRAAQFSPFAALTGHDAAIKETARLTDKRIELDENEKALLDEKLQQLAENLNSQKSHLKNDDDVRGSSLSEASITYFQPDISKDGGAYVVKRGCVKKIDTYRKVIVMNDFYEIKIEDIIDIDFSNDLNI